MNYLLYLFFALQPRYEVCMSTQFGHVGDGYGGRTPTVLFNRPVAPGDFGIAHRTWPIGTFVRVTNINTGQYSFGVVLDRGPYGKVDADGNWFNSRKFLDRIGVYKGCADLTPDIASAIGHKGRTLVEITRWRR